MHVYVFNISNPGEFLKGESAEMHELGPYDYDLKVRISPFNSALIYNDPVIYIYIYAYRYTEEILNSQTVDLRWILWCIMS